MNYIIENLKEKNYYIFNNNINKIIVFVTELNLVNKYIYNK
jgi:hypothetical protein